MKKINLYTDGSCLGNPGPGGYAALLQYKSTEKALSQGYQHTTNNRMELLAVIEGLKAIKESCEVHIFTDSQYVKQGLEKWIYNWKRNNWKTADKKPVKNKDLWQALDEAVNQHQVKWHWVKGHSGHPQNERVDDLAREAASSSSLLQDSGFL